jgi:hypothetical protein
MAGPSGQTPRLLLPYPIPDDTVDVPRDVKALADALDVIRSLGTPVVTALPIGPADGTEVYYQTAAMAAVGVIWHLRYRAAIADAYKWEYVGGGPLQHEVLASQNATVTSTWTNLATDGPLVTCPLAGIYTFNFGCKFQMGGRLLTQQCGVAIGDTIPAAAPMLQQSTPDTGTPFASGTAVSSAAARTRFTVAAGNITKLRYWSTLATGGANFIERWLDAHPLRVG